MTCTIVQLQTLRGIAAPLPAVPARRRGSCDSTSGVGGPAAPQRRWRQRQRQQRQTTAASAVPGGDEGSALASQFQSFINQQGLPSLLRDRRPTHLMSPLACIAAQMDALQLNDWPEKDAGVQTAFAFAKSEEAAEPLSPQVGAALRMAVPELWRLREHACCSSCHHAAITLAHRRLMRARLCRCRCGGPGAGLPARSGWRWQTLVTSCTRRPMPQCSTATAGRWVLGGRWSNPAGAGALRCNASAAWDA